MLPQKAEELRKAAIENKTRELEGLFRSIAERHASDFEGQRTHSRRGRRGDDKRGGGGGVLITSDGRTIILSAESRRLPPAFTDFRRTLRNTEQQLSNVNGTLTELRQAFASAAELQLPDEAILAVEESHRDYLNMLSRTRLETFSKQIGAAKVGNNPKLEEEWTMNVLRARAAAADEGYNEEQSVTDYAVNDFSHVHNSDTTLQQQVAAIADSLNKIEVSAGNIAECEQSTEVQWWSSASCTRLIKTNAIRANYHARLAFKWNLCCREHFFLQASLLNLRSDQCRTDLVQLQKQLSLFESRTVESKEKLESINKETEELSDMLKSAHERRLTLQEGLKEKAKHMDIIYPGDEDSVNAELALLLKVPTWPKALMPDVERVIRWIKSEPCSLE